MSRQRIPMPPDDVLADVAHRHRVTVKDLRAELESPNPLSAWDDLRGAALEAYRHRKAMEEIARRHAEHQTRKLQAICDRYGISFSALLREKSEGDWPDYESAARYLSSHPKWMNWLERVFG